MLAATLAACAWQSEKIYGTYVDAPKLLDAVKADDFLEQLVPVLLAARGLGEPESPRVLQLMLDVEVGWIVEDGHDLAIVGGSASGRAVR